jgi:hypothetical protein
MQGKLVLTILNVQSSYIQVIEEPLRAHGEVPDTVQWWISPTGSWRIRTFAIDHDIHTHSVGHAENLEELAVSNTLKNYGDIMHSQHVIEISNSLSANETKAAFLSAGLEPNLEIAEGHFLFWKPDDASYQTQSEPS